MRSTKGARPNPAPTLREFAQGSKPNPLPWATRRMDLLEVEEGRGPDEEEARRALRQWAQRWDFHGRGGIDWAAYGRAFLYKAPGAVESFDRYKLRIAAPVHGRSHALVAFEDLIKEAAEKVARDKGDQTVAGFPLPSSKDPDVSTYPTEDRRVREMINAYAKKGRFAVATQKGYGPKAPKRTRYLQDVERAQGGAGPLPWGLTVEQSESTGAGHYRDPQARRALTFSDFWRDYMKVPDKGRREILKHALLFPGDVEDLALGRSPSGYEDTPQKERTRAALAEQIKEDLGARDLRGPYFLTVAEDVRGDPPPRGKVRVLVAGPSARRSGPGADDARVAATVTLPAADVYERMADFMVFYGPNRETGGLSPARVRELSETDPAPAAGDPAAADPVRGAQLQKAAGPGAPAVAARVLQDTIDNAESEIECCGGSHRAAFYPHRSQPAEQMDGAPFPPGVAFVGPVPSSWSFQDKMKYIKAIQGRPEAAGFVPVSLDVLGGILGRGANFTPGSVQVTETEFDPKEIEAAGGAWAKANPPRLLPLAPEGRPWSGAKARRQLSKLPIERARRGFLYAPPTMPRSRWKLPIAYVEGGRLYAVPRAIESAHGAIDGARGGVKGISRKDRAHAKATIDRYYLKMKRAAPAWRNAMSGNSYDADEWVYFFAEPGEPSAGTLARADAFADAVDDLWFDEMDAGDNYPGRHTLAYLAYGSIAGHGIGLWDGRLGDSGDEFEALVMSRPALVRAGEILDESIMTDQEEGGKDPALNSPTVGDKARRRRRVRSNHSKRQHDYLQTQARDASVYYREARRRAAQAGDAEGVDLYDGLYHYQDGQKDAHYLSGQSYGENVEAARAQLKRAAESYQRAAAGANPPQQKWIRHTTGSHAGQKLLFGPRAGDGFVIVTPYTPRSGPQAIREDARHYAAVYEQERGQKVPKGTRYLLIDHANGRTTAHKTVKAAKAAGEKALGVKPKKNKAKKKSGGPSVLMSHGKGNPPKRQPLPKGAQAEKVGRFVVHRSVKSNRGRVAVKANGWSVTNSKGELVGTYTTKQKATQAARRRTK